MKKKVFLAIIPALLVLSSCAGIQSKEKINLFVEDTLAHEEIFGNLKSNLFETRVRKLDDVVEHPDGTAAIGVQSTSESSGHISFRFVAPVAFTNENITPTVAQWTRTVSKRDGSAYPKDTGTVASTVAYTKITNGGDEYTIGQYNTANGTSYTHFVVYTLRNVPVDSNDYFVSAYLNLSGEGGVSLTTKAIAINAAQTLKYSYTHDLGTAFMDGTFNGTPDVINATSVRTSVGDTNKATFEGLNLKENDSFSIKEFYETKLYTKGSSRLTGKDNPIGYWFGNDSGSIKTNYDGTYNLYLNKSDEIWTAASNVDNDGYLYVNVNVSWWGNDSAWTSVYAYRGDLNGEHTGKWFALSGTFWGNTFSTHTEDKFFTSTTYAAGYTTLAVCRLKNGTNLPGDKTVWDSSIVHNRYDVALKTNGLEDCAYLTGDVTISMGSR